jgi:hypothetical protein
MAPPDKERDPDAAVLKAMLWTLIPVVICTGGYFAFAGYRSNGIKMQLHHLVEARLKDPASVQYRNERIVKTSEVSYALCGEVNSKNGFGGYAGFTRFVAEDLTNGAYIEDEHDGLFDYFWDRNCKSANVPAAERHLR